MAQATRAARKAFFAGLPPPDRGREAREAYLKAWIQRLDCGGEGAFLAFMSSRDVPEGDGVWDLVFSFFNTKDRRALLLGSSLSPDLKAKFFNAYLPPPTAEARVRRKAYLEECIPRPDAEGEFLGFMSRLGARESDLIWNSVFSCFNTEARSAVLRESRSLSPTLIARFEMYLLAFKEAGRRNYEEWPADHVRSRTGVAASPPAPVASPPADEWLKHFKGCRSASDVVKKFTLRQALRVLATLKGSSRGAWRPVLLAFYRDQFKFPTWLVFLLVLTVVPAILIGLYQCWRGRVYSYSWTLGKNEPVPAWERFSTDGTVVVWTGGKGGEVCLLSPSLSALLHAMPSSESRGAAAPK